MTDSTDAVRLQRDLMGLGFNPYQSKRMVDAFGPNYTGAFTWGYDGVQQITGNTDASLMTIGSWALASGAFSTLLGGGDFAHYFFAHNVTLNSVGNITTTYDPTSTSYAMLFSDAGMLSVYEAAATGVAGAAPSFSATPTFALNMITGALAIAGALTLGTLTTPGILKNSAAGVVSANSTITAAAIAANFSASGYITLTMGAATVYVPYDTATW